jgi:hypothetical protein
MPSEEYRNRVNVPFSAEEARAIRKMAAEEPKRIAMGRLVQRVMVGVLTEKGLLKKRK